MSRLSSVQFFSIPYIVISLLLASPMSTLAGDKMDLGDVPSASTYPRAEERAKMLALIEQTQPQVLRIKYPSQITPENRALVDLFAKEFWPLSAKLEAMGIKSGLYSVANDRALYNDKAEQEVWKKAEHELDVEIARIRTSPDYKALIARMKVTSSKATGQLAEMAKEIVSMDELANYTEAEMPLLARLSELSIEISARKKDLPLMNRQEEYERKRNEIEGSYRSGRMSFTDAVAKIDALYDIGHAAQGAEVVKAVGALINETAQIRSKLAHSKGFENWAQFRLRIQARHYARGHQNVPERTLLLRNLIEEATDTAKAVYQRRLVEVLGPKAPKIEDLTPTQASLLLPDTNTATIPYFQAERADSAVLQTLRESGFNMSRIAGIVRDSYPRQSKHKHAYMAQVISHQPKWIDLDGRNLALAAPPDNAKFWNPAGIYIVQNIRDHGLDNWRTSYHENGHGVDYSLRQDYLGQGQDSAWAETHSTTFEQFLVDREFLRAMGRDSNGKAIPEAVIDAYLANTQINNFLSLRGQSVNALFDLEVWGYDYSQEGAEQITDRMLRLRKELTAKYSIPQKGLEIGGINQANGYFVTDHFWGGRVGYIGYIYAEIAAQITYATLLDQFERETGRRTMHRQPTLAKKLSEAYYLRGFNKPFPEAIEDFSGKRFDLLDGSRAMRVEVERWLASPLESLVPTTSAKPSRQSRALRCEASFLRAG